PRHVAVNGIDLDRFRPAPERRVANRVLYLRRKATWRHGPAALARLPAELRTSIEVVDLDNRMTEAEMIAAYQAADIFLALGYPEGFALPPLEAMASGAAVAGFTGGGGAEHMIDGDSALVVPDGDDAALATALSRLLRDLPLREKIRRGGYEISRHFGMDRMRAAVLSFAEDILSSGYGPAS
ncbi:MAG: glycosyltransferase family 4 protein, partial [Hyphomicrobiales bacterium]|nr:glycosyltransferase family 4 protein [Hyphomicrobiales bacterium]